jgi:hypothetical protein
VDAMRFWGGQPRPVVFGMNHTRWLVRGPRRWAAVSSSVPSIHQLKPAHSQRIGSRTLARVPRVTPGQDRSSQGQEMLLEGHWGGGG